MAICLYSNGIVEEFKPAKLTFTENELIKSFGEYKTIKSKRLIEVPNGWCVWGEMENPDPIEFNRICTDILEVYVFSHVIFIHDSELDPKWKLNDMIYKNYVDFTSDISIFIEEMSTKIVEEIDEMQAQGKNQNMIYLTTAGKIKDKLVIYMFNPAEQSDDFYKDGSFSNFSDNITEYLKKHFKLNEPLTIFSDKKIIINVEKDNVQDLFAKMLKHFEVKEHYETCAELSHLFDDWTTYINNMPPKKKRGRPKKNVDKEGK